MQNGSVEQISIPYPEESDRVLKIAVGACRLRIVPGEGEMWVTGTYSDQSRSLPLRLVQEGGTVTITQGHEWGNLFDLRSGTPTVDLAIGKARPFVLTLESGASENNVDLGGLPLNLLAVKHGAGKMVIDFSAPNPQAMTLLSIDAGAGSVDLTNLANANFAELTVTGGALACKLDFGSPLRRDAHVKITTGVSSVEIRVPPTTAAKITSQATLGGLDVGDGFTKTGGAFVTSGALAGSTPILSIDAKVAVGSLILRTL